MTFEPSESRFQLITPRFVMGLAIALVGVVLVLDRLNLAVASQILRFWPVAIVLTGGLIFVQSRKVGGGVNGIVVMIIGGWLLLNSLGIVRLRFWELFWPMILILIGTVLVVQTLKHRSKAAAGADADDTITIFAALSGVQRKSAARRFRGGEVSVFMGGGHIDLREATIPRGEEAVLDIFAVMGGCEILVPPSWSVATPLVPLMGGVEDKRLSALPQGVEATAGGLAPPRLVLRGLVMMGGVVIKS
jgi:predicted membrane protein